MINLAYQWVQSRGLTVELARAKWGGCCIDFAGDFIEAIGRGRLMYFALPNHPRWKYHAAAEIDGFIHDLWYDEPTPTNEYALYLGCDEYDCPSEDFEDA